MSYNRKYDFQSGTRISSSQVDEEFDNLIAAANNLDASTKALDETKETKIRSQEKADAAKNAAINASVQHTQGTKKMMMQAYSTGTITIPPNNFTLSAITFATAFAESPTIVDSMASSQSAKNCSVGIGVKTTTNVNVWVYNDHPTETRYIIVNLLVYGTKAL